MRTEPSPWWPSTKAGRIGLAAWLLLHFVPWCVGGSPWNALFSAALWYLVIVAVRALAYPRPKAPRDATTA